ncbi:cellulose binding domain-containing protein [Streptomyces shaanxiensis]
MLSGGNSTVRNNARPGRPAPPPTSWSATWPGGHQAEVTVKNTGTGPITGWTVDWELGGSTVTSLWNGGHTVANGRIAVRNTSSNGTLAVGATTSFGYTANGTAGTPAPRCTPA